MLDYGALPPEVNSSRMYAGPGSGSIMAAASAWQAIAIQLDSVAHGYTAVILGLHTFAADVRGAATPAGPRVRPVRECFHGREFRDGGFHDVDVNTDNHRRH